MARGPRKHLKRLNAPKHWMLSKLDGIYASRPSQGPHKLRECIPISILLRHKLRYALTGREVMKIVKEGNISVNGQVRTDPRFPLGLMDVIEIDKTNEQFRLLLDCKGRFVCQPTREPDYTLVRIVKKFKGAGGKVMCVAHNSWTFAYPHPDMQINDSVYLKISEKNDPTHHDVVKFKIGCEALCTGGRNKGRIGVMTKHTKIPASQDIVSLEDVQGNTFSTQLRNLFVVGDAKGANKVEYTRSRGLRKSIVEERKLRMKRQPILKQSK